MADRTPMPFGVVLDTQPSAVILGYAARDQAENSATERNARAVELGISARYAAITVTTGGKAAD